jgi:hypothetical protein
MLIDTSEIWVGRHNVWVRDYVQLAQPSTEKKEEPSWEWCRKFIPTDKDISYGVHVPNSQVSGVNL